jgi:SAM-dependent methyltransferase
MTDATAVNGLSAYSALAAEYYDADLHPTCANFRWASDRLLDRLLLWPPGRYLCDVGAGDSALASWLDRNGHSVEGVRLFDDSVEMLAHSARWVRAGAVATRAAASELPLESSCVDLLVASLADPFNDLAWWREVERVLASDGRALVTLPAAGWARRFRANAGEPSERARFLTRDGLWIDVPSHVCSRAKELELIDQAGLRVVGEGQIVREEIPAPVSPKLQVLDAADAVVVAYLVAR